jgi:hypothetical protein
LIVEDEFLLRINRASAECFVSNIKLYRAVAADLRMVIEDMRSKVAVSHE